jgi:hypothetical protein
MPIERISLLSLLLAAVLLWAGCIGGTANVQVVQAQNPLRAPQSVDHTAFDRVLDAYVDAQGQVDYAALKQNADRDLVPYLELLASTDPSNLDREERLAFWINAYNAYTLKLVVDHYPVESIRDIKPGAGPSIPKVNSPFKLDVGAVADTIRSLDDIEHGIIRERFDEPRIHFVLVCAAVSCPRLRQEAYTGDALDEQLEDQTMTFLRTEGKNDIPSDEDEIALSRIFKWYGQDFGDSTDDLQRYLARYFDGTVHETLANAAYDVDYLDYDWSLNDQHSESSPSPAGE